ncbi:hypothetical protein Tco_0897472 [Tanacetum coccineum]
MMICQGIHVVADICPAVESVVNVNVLHVAFAQRVAWFASNKLLVYAPLSLALWEAMNSKHASQLLNCLADLGLHLHADTNNRFFEMEKRDGNLGSDHEVHPFVQEMSRIDQQYPPQYQYGPPPPHYSYPVQPPPPQGYPPPGMYGPPPHQGYPPPGMYGPPQQGYPPPGMYGPPPQHGYPPGPYASPPPPPQYK